MTNLNQNGRSMIEMLGVLAIIGVLSVGGIAGYSKAMMKFKTNKTIDQIAMTVTNIRTLYAQQPYYDITTEDAYDMGVIDDAMADGTQTPGANSLKNAFNGKVYIDKAKSGAVGEKSTGAFVVTFAGLPREACVSISTNDWGSNYSSGLLGVGVGHGTIDKAQNLPCYIAGGQGATEDPNNYAAAHGVIADDPDTEENEAKEAEEETGGVTEKGCASAKEIPFAVDKAATGCDCADNTCFVTFKYY